ncbi:multiple sugar transport system permease protein [Thermocatellispora tengchongensis]|uniref:Multiple sugar transport system permease protein n=1 Tax=Thermocatellispora tengchongensis TaxID=1073253 RepID=A0A840PNB6_9ACTN|nr:sugar ABC transporter permease [Thermocatellispora tengchongensis]MBB5139190.1 multiple sugar transport system permease protein [Thermocatellispora tengchongensis]
MVTGAFVEVPPAAQAAGGAADAPPAGARSRAPWRALWRRAVRLAPPYLFLAPALVLLVVWTYRPLAQTFYLSFFSWNLVPDVPMVPVGTANYERLLTTPDLADSVGLTFVVIVAMLPFTLVLPVVVALLTRRVRGRAAAAYRALIFAPMLVAPVAGAAVWQWLLDPSAGIVNTLLGTGTNWLNSVDTSLWAIIAITGWHVAGFAVLVVSAGLTGINPDYAAAAQVDGASRGQITRWVTLPLLSPTLAFLLLMTVLLSAQWTFPLIDTLTQGGPVGSTTTVYYLLWEYGFRSHDAGLAAAAGVLFFAGFMLVASLLARISDRLSRYDD